MSLEQFKKEGIAFFSEAINKWNRLIELYNELREEYYSPSYEKVEEANKILTWFQDNYVHHRKYSNFRVILTRPNGKKTSIDPIFDVAFRGANIQWLCARAPEFNQELNEGPAHLRGHLSSIKNLKNLPKEEVPLLRIRKILAGYHLVANQLKRRRKNKTPYIIEDEYDVQDLLHALLRLDFGDIRKEEWTPSYAGGASRIDLVLKKEGILIEVKKTRASLREKQIGDELIVDIERYKEYPDISTLVCFIYDPKQLIENPKGLEHDLEKQSTERLNVEAYVSPRSG